MPTNQERCFHGMGGGGDNLKVYDTDIGRIGGLVCWENHMILIRALMALQGEEIHIANWPGTWSGLPTENMTYVDQESKNPSLIILAILNRQSGPTPLKRRLLSLVHAATSLPMKYRMTFLIKKKPTGTGQMAAVQSLIRLAVTSLNRFMIKKPLSLQN